MESFATGLKRISEACGKAGVKVEFYGDEYGFTVRFYRHCGEGWRDSQTKCNTQKNVQSDNGTLNGTLNSSDEQKERLKALIRQNSKITRKQMADSLDVSARTIQRLLNDMPEIHFTGDGRSGHWEIDDGEHIIYVNGADKDASTELGKLMHDFFCTDPDDMHYRELANKVRYFKEDEKGVAAMCKVMEDMRNEAVEKDRIQNAIEMLKDGLSIEKVAQYSRLAVERVKELAAPKAVH